MITVAETIPFQRKAATLLSTEERDDLIAYVAEHPSAGDLIQGIGGIRKIRWAHGNKGKSGGVRVIYYYHSKIMHYIYLPYSERMKKQMYQRKKSISYRVW